MTRASTIGGKRSLGSKGVSIDERWIRLHYRGMSSPYLGAHRYGHTALKTLNYFQEVKTSDHTTQKPQEPEAWSHNTEGNIRFVSESVPSVIATHEVSLIVPESIPLLERHGILGQSV